MNEIILLLLIWRENEKVHSISKYKRPPMEKSAAVWTHTERSRNFPSAVVSRIKRGRWMKERKCRHTKNVSSTANS